MEKKLGVVNSCIKCFFEEKKSFVSPSVCLTVFESADARDLGLMTLFSRLIRVAIGLLSNDMHDGVSASL